MAIAGECHTLKLKKIVLHPLVRVDSKFHYCYYVLCAVDENEKNERKNQHNKKK
jgi:hypothetical protein